MRCALALAALAACGGGTHLGFDAGTDDGPVAVADAHADSIGTLATIRPHLDPATLTIDGTEVQTFPP